MSGFIENAPTSWDALKKYHLNPPNSADELKRTKLVQTTYNLKRRMILSYTDYLISLLFPENNQKEQEEKWIITNNLYPYNLEPGIEHKIFWIRPGVQMSENKVIKLVEENYPNREYVLFKHQDHVRSNIAIEHYQLFFKTSKSYLE